MPPIPPSHASDEKGQQNPLLERLIEHAPIGIAYLEGPEHRVKIANPMLYKFFPNRGELTGHTPAELIPELAEIAKARIERVYETGEAFRLEDVLIPLQEDGRVGDRFFSYSLNPVHDAQGQVNGVLCIIRESTDEVRARQALERANAALYTSEERSTIAQAATEIGVWEWQSRTNRVWWSSQSYEIYGYPPDLPMSLETSLERLHPEDRDGVFAKMQKAIVSRKDFRLEYRILHPERGVRWLEGFARILYEADGQAQRMVGTVRDITARKEMENTLRESLERERSKAAELAAIMDAVPAMVLISHDPASRFIDGNRTAHEILQVPQGTNLSKTGPAGQSPRNFRIMRQGREIAPGELPVQLAASKGIVLRKYDLTVVMKEGEQTDLIGNVTPLFDSNGKPAGAVAAFIDITGQRQATEELNRLNSELERRVAEQEKSRQKLQKLIEISNRVIAAQSVRGMLQILADAAVELTEARAGVCGQDFRGDKFQVRATSYVPGSASLTGGQETSPERDKVYWEWIHQTPSFRLTQTQSAGQPVRRGQPKGHSQVHGLMGVRLTGLGDRPDGLILVVDRVNGDFTAEDEALLAQLAVLASLSLRQIRLSEEAELAAQDAARRAAAAEDCQRVLEALMEYVPEGIIIAEGPDALIRGVSRYGREILGPLSEQVAGELQAYDEDGLNPLPVEDYPLIKAIRKGEVVINRQLVQINAAGLPLLLACNAGPIRDRSGAVVGGVAAWRDISELRQAQDALRRSETRLRVALASMPVTMFALDRGLRYTWMHHRHPGLKEKMIMGRRVDEIRSPEEMAELAALQQAVIDTGKGVKKEIRLRVRGVWSRFTVTLEPVKNARGEVTGMTGAMVEVKGMDSLA